MKKVLFKNKAFYRLLLAYLLLLVTYNVYATFKATNLYCLLPIFIQIALLIFILTKDKNAKLFIQIWVIVALIIGSGAEIMANLLEGFENLKLNSFIFNGLQLGIGLLIWDYTRRTVIVVSPDSNLPTGLDPGDVSQKYIASAFPTSLTTNQTQYPS
jgi:hypothetical protein